ncbi:MAG: sulfite exporter TauE/SafE family protein [Gammaproteobacteria bacterium]|nr:sulfite exporter TauE/SafE family protein [Gammaproteobacteria bacterium]
MWLSALLLVSVLATSVLSGILGMAGGMILMAILVSTVSVATAMMIHGVIQATSNGSRAWFLRSHIQWRILPAYLVGASAALAGFMAFILVPDPGVVLILVGVFPWLARIVPNLRGLDINRPSTTFACGVIVTSAQLIAGASGPLLDVFYLNSSLNRHQIVASKAVTQTLGHLIKLGYYGVFIGAVENMAAWFYFAAMATAVLGARIGTRLLDKLKDDTFRRISGWVILTIAGICMISGVLDLVS